MRDRIHQFKITLREIDPPIWRCILVPEDYNFWDLHVAIQDAMGWLDYHLHAFRIRRKHGHSVAEIGIPVEEQFDDEPEVLAGWEVPVSRYFNDVGVCAEYQYDFGDSWKHDVLLEGILLREKSQKYPQCIDGARACPPEDCGGVSGYCGLLEIIADPDHEEHEDMMTWVGGKYDPEEFSPDKVKFDNPKKRWRHAFSNG
ncbi:MAG: plasmid pRiA4b ORF-3 family protein [bacterium]